MKSLIAFLKFIKDNHIEAVAKENLRAAREMDIPLMKLFKDVPDEAMVAQGINGIDEFYTSLLNNTYHEVQMKSLRLWEEDKLPGIPKDSIEPSDLVLIYAVQKKGYLKFLPLYTKDSREALEIVAELDGVYIDGQNAAINMLFKMRKEVENEYRKVSERFQLLVESAKDYAIFMIDENGIIISWNKGAESFKGYTAEEAIGSHISIFYTPDEIAGNEPAFNLATAKEKGRYETEGWRRRKNGTRFWADVIFTALYDEAGKFRGFSKVTRDITERKQAEEKISGLNHTLTEKIGELETVNKELEAFSYSVSHDLRAPLRAIHSYTQILADEYTDKLDDGARQKMSRVMFNAKKMGHLIDDLLAFSKTGRKELQTQELDMSLLTKLIVKELESVAPHANTVITIGDLLPVKADHSLIRQVLSNLISNAIKYSQNKSEPRIEIGSYSGENENIYFIKDNGAGFDMRHYNKLFGVFQRLHSSEDFEGTGVGLALVKRIVVKHGGRIWAEAEPDKGATFYFSLPNNVTDKI